MPDVVHITDLPEPPSPNGKEVLVPGTSEEWRAWLAANPARREGAWVVFRKKSSAVTGPIYDELVLEALCFGWIDSLTKRLDDDRTIQWFSPRRPGGVWSPLTKQRIERLEGEGRMTDAGRVVIEAAKADGSWSRWDEVEALVLPEDLAAALAGAPGARAAYDALAASRKKQYLWWILDAKRPQTRAGRVAETVRQLSGGP